MNTPLEMSGELLHWRVLLKYIKSQVKNINGFILERDVIRHFAPLGLKSRQRAFEENKVTKALEGLYEAGWCKVTLGQTASGIGRVITLVKYPSGTGDERQQYQGNTEGNDYEGLSL